MSMPAPRPFTSAARVIPLASARTAGPMAEPVRAALASARAHELATALHTGDPMRASFDVAVRRFVRGERAEGRDLDTILASIASVLRTHVEPTLTPERGEALQRAVAWFTVSEFYRGD
jgi:hypothetical protein